MKYTLTGLVTVSAHTEVEADSLEAAIKVARSRCVWMHYEGSGTDTVRDWCVEDVEGDVEHIICSKAVE